MGRYFPAIQAVPVTHLSVDDKARVCKRCGIDIMTARETTTICRDCAIADKPMGRIARNKARQGELREKWIDLDMALRRAEIALLHREFAAIHRLAA